MKKFPKKKVEQQMLLILLKELDVDVIVECINESTKGYEIEVALDRQPHS